jgi:hypothetical protein
MWMGIKFNPNDYDEDPGYKRGYQFGDLTKGLVRKFGQSVTSLTGKEEYEFGDLSKWMDQQAKSKVKKFTKNPNGEYQFGDISKEILRRIQKGEYTLDDVILFLKIVIAIGIEFQPIARVLPVKVLMEMVNVGIAQDLSGKVIGALTKELDERMKQVVTGDKDYQLGDFTKKAITGSKDYQVGDLTKKRILKFTGKESYTLGDITRTLLNDEQSIMKGTASVNNSNSGGSNNNNRQEIVLDDQLLKDLESWDAKFLEARQQKQRKEDDSDNASS